MLAMLPSSVSHYDNRHVPVLATSPLPFPKASPPVGSGQMRTSRPTLTINTAIHSSKARSFGKGSSLSIHTLSAVSPTTKNTFANTYQPPSNASPVVRGATLPTLSILTKPEESPPDSTTVHATSSLITTTLTTNEQQPNFPYAIPIGVSSILVTSITYKSRQSTMSQDLRPGLASKRVSFRDPLDEEIKNLKYVLAHSDIESSVSTIEKDDAGQSCSLQDLVRSSSSAQELHQAESSLAKKSLKDNAGSDDGKSPITVTRSQGRPQRHNSSPKPSSLKRDSSSDEDSDDAVPKTPVAGRCKRRRDWTWTLDPLPGQKSEDSVASHDDDSVSTSSRVSESSSQ